MGLKQRGELADHVLLLVCLPFVVVPIAIMRACVLSIDKLNGKSERARRDYISTCCDLQRLAVKTSPIYLHNLGMYMVDVSSCLLSCFRAISC